MYNSICAAASFTIFGSSSTLTLKPKASFSLGAAGPKQRRAAVAAEVADDGLAVVGFLGDRLGRACGDGEVGLGNREDDAEDAAGGFAVIEAVAY